MLIMMLTGCTQTFIQDANHERVLIDWPVKNRTEQAIADNCPQVDGKTTLGCARWYTDRITRRGVCTIYAQDYTELYSTQADVFLHEVTHCFFAHFHPPIEKRDADTD